MKLITITIASCCSLLAVSPAWAEEQRAFSGPRIGVEAGWARVSGGERRGTDGFSYGAVVGYDIASGAFRFAPELKVALSTQKRCRDYAAGGEEARVCHRTDRDLYVGGRVGYVASPKVLIFAAGGYTNGRFSDHFHRLSAGSDRDIKIGRDIGGYRLGGGAEYAVAPNVYLSATYQYSGWKHKDWRHHVHQNQLLAGVGYRF